jgi:hypothetical protein
VAEETKPEPAPAKKLPLKTIVVVLGMLVAEGAGIMVFMSMLGKPSEVQGVHLDSDHSAENEKLVEIPVLSEKYTNSSTGRMWIWDTEIIIKVKSKHAGAAPAGKDAKKDDGHGGHGGDAHGDAAHAAPGVREELAGRLAEVRTGIGSIWGSAQHNYFSEPGRETLTRQTLEYLRRAFGQDAAGEDRIQAVLIPKCLGYPADF